MNAIQCIYLYTMYYFDYYREFGWHHELRYWDGRKCMAQKEFFGYEMFVCCKEFSSILRGMKLIQQFLHTINYNV